MIMKNDMNQVVITGGAGFIGSNLIKKLLDEGVEKILIIDDFSTGNFQNIKKYLDLHEEYLTRLCVRDEWWAKKYHYEYWTNGCLFYPYQNKDFPSGSPF